MTFFRFALLMSVLCVLSLAGCSSEQVAREEAPRESATEVAKVLQHRVLPILRDDSGIPDARFGTYILVNRYLGPGSEQLQKKMDALLKELRGRLVPYSDGLPAENLSLFLVPTMLKDEWWNVDAYDSVFSVRILETVAFRDCQSPLMESRSGPFFVTVGFMDGNETISTPTCPVVFHDLSDYHPKTYRMFITAYIKALNHCEEYACPDVSVFKIQLASWLSNVSDGVELYTADASLADVLHWAVGE